jgi:hypothetical protein
MGYLFNWVKIFPFFLVRRWVGSNAYDGAYLCWKNPYDSESKDVCEPVEVVEVFDGEWIVRSRKRVYEIKKQQLLNMVAILDEKINPIPKTKDTFND